MHDKEESHLPIRDDQLSEVPELPEVQSTQELAPLRVQEEITEGTQKPEPTNSESPHDQTLVIPKQIEIHPTYWKKILSQHRKWVKSGGKSGERANFADAHLEGWNFEGVDLPQAILRNARLRGSNFSEADLSESDLQGADLREVDFRGSSLLGADLHAANVGKAILNGADLRNANLTSVSGLLPKQLTGADLSGAELSEHMRRFEGLTWVKELTSHAKKLFLFMLILSGYAWLIVAKTTDAHLVASPSIFTLPVINIEFPVVGFYWLAPFLLILMYMYYHLSLQRLWKELADLPAVFPDGKRIEEKTYPWLLNSFVQAHTHHSGRIRTAFSRLQILIPVGLAWWMVPLLLILFGVGTSADTNGV